MPKKSMQTMLSMIITHRMQSMTKFNLNCLCLEKERVNFRPNEYYGILQRAPAHHEWICEKNYWPCRSKSLFSVMHPQLNQKRRNLNRKQRCGWIQPLIWFNFKPTEGTVWQSWHPRKLLLPVGLSKPCFGAGVLMGHII